MFIILIIKKAKWKKKIMKKCHLVRINLRIYHNGDEYAILINRYSMKNIFKVKLNCTRIHYITYWIRMGNLSTQSKKKNQFWLIQFEICGSLSKYRVSAERTKKVLWYMITIYQIARYLNGSWTHALHWRTISFDVQTPGYFSKVTEAFKVERFIWTELSLNTNLK